LLPPTRSDQQQSKTKRWPLHTFPIVENVRQQQLLQLRPNQSPQREPNHLVHLAPLCNPELANGRLRHSGELQLHQGCPLLLANIAMQEPPTSRQIQMPTAATAAMEQRKKSDAAMRTSEQRGLQRPRTWSNL